MASDRNTSSAGFQPLLLVSPSARESQQAYQDLDHDCVPTIKVDASEVRFAVTSTLPEAAGIIDPTLLHAPFLRRPLFIPVPGSGRRALKDWYPEASRDNGQREEEERHITQLLSKFKYWLRYEESELYQDIAPGQLLQLCDGDKPGHVYEVQGNIGSVGPGIAFWAAPCEEEPLPQAVVLFLPPGTHCPPGTKALLQELVVEAIEFTEVEQDLPTLSS